MRITPLVLIIVDGFGIATGEEQKHSIVAHTDMPTINSLIAQSTTVHLTCSGRAVGLPEGYMGNSEVGHLTIGAGRVINQSFITIEESIKDKSLFTLPQLQEAIHRIKERKGKLHCMGLLSCSGVHGHLSHFIAMLELAKRYDIEIVFHIFTDGRDSEPFEGVDFIKRLQDAIEQEGVGTIASVMGRYFAMDRDKRWERIEKAYTVLTEEGSCIDDIYTYLKESYAKGITDEFIEPAICVPHSRIVDNDGVFFLNFRADRARQLTTALLGEAPFSASHAKLHLSACITMTRYAKELETTVLFEKEEPVNTLGDILSSHGLRQLRIAETEKYAHVTYFFNGGREKKGEGEVHCLIPSPQDVPTYDYKPEMSAYEVTQTICNALDSNLYDVYVCNFANLDMVGHTGNKIAGKKALMVIDECINTIIKTVRSYGGGTIITADHGNIEAIQHNSDELHTAHTHNDVYCFFDLPPSLQNIQSRNGELQDIAPTVLYLLGIEKPKEMNGTSLLYQEDA